MNDQLENLTEVSTKKHSKFKLFLISILAVVPILIIGVLGYAYTHRVDYVILSPGDAVSVNDAIKIESKNIDSSKGDIKFLTVLVSSQRPTLLEYWKAKYWDEHTSIYKWQDVNGTLTSQESLKLSMMMMKQSQSAASAVALEAVGCDVPKQGTGATIIEVTKGSPAQKVGLVAGDTIVEINSVQTETDSDVMKEIRKNKVGSTIQLVYEDKDDKKHTVSTVLAKHPDEKGKPFLGVLMATRDFKLDFPIDITFEAGDVSGPSAGLAFTLGAIDKLSQGELTGGNIIAATGEIDLDGNIRQVGGVEQKTIAAKRAGAKLMLVPKGELNEAKKNAGNMKVVEVSNVDQALKELYKLGGDKVGRVRECTK